MTTVAVRDINIKGYILSVTTRHQLCDTVEQMNELTFRTIETWLFIADLLERGIYEIKAEGSIESRYEASKGVKLTEHFNDSRVTIWDTFRGQKTPHFHLNSDDDTQQAINVWSAQNEAVQRIMAKHAVDSAENTTPDAPQAPQTSAANAPAITTPTTPQAPIAGVIAVNGKSKAKELAPGQQFSMRIVQVAAAMSKTGVLTYELYCAYGGKPGQYPDLLVYSDNEHAVNSGLVGKLAAMSLKAGGSMTGQWFVTGNVYESNGKKGLNVTGFEAVTA